ncbi:lipoyl(octanoyl) transferase LipB [bacterium]|nr:lipoyl(octanoyl) transferase LipB [bacterium]MCI0602140.1 lipoyl(octanoyl) transferase LipB [bacterium]
MSTGTRIETPVCELIILDKLSYKQAVALQEFSANRVAEGTEQEKFILLQHPHVITLGRGFHKENLLFSKEWLEEHDVSVEESGRGGDVTYHGPGQVVGYPILNISKEPDLHLYLRNLEELMIRCVADFGIEAHREPGMTGAWVGQEKIGAIGVRVSRWITSHGFALNVNTDLKYFEFIVPCGIRQYGVTSLKKILGHDVDVTEVHRSLIIHFEQIFRRRISLVGS